MKIVALSDTHGHHSDVDVPMGDVLVFAGDFMTCGYKEREARGFMEWVECLPHRYKIVVAGNHDRYVEKNRRIFESDLNIRGIRYLQDSATIIDGVKFYGSPHQPWFYDWAFNVHRGAPIKKYWDLIPDDTDVLITHGPPEGILDQCIPNGSTSTWGSKIIIPPSEHLGCEELRKVVDRISPKVHIFGHIHGSYGTQGYTNDVATSLMMPKTPTRYYNVAICNEQYNPVNEPWVIELNK